MSSDAYADYLPLGEPFAQLSQDHVFDLDLERDRLWERAFSGKYCDQAEREFNARFPVPPIVETKMQEIRQGIVENDTDVIVDQLAMFWKEVRAEWSIFTKHWVTHPSVSSLLARFLSHESTKVHKTAANVILFSMQQYELCDVRVRDVLLATWPKSRTGFRLLLASSLTHFAGSDSWKCIAETLGERGSKTEVSLFALSLLNGIKRLKESGASIPDLNGGLSAAILKNANNEAAVNLFRRSEEQLM